MNAFIKVLRLPTLIVSAIILLCTISLTNGQFVFGNNSQAHADTTTPTPTPNISKTLTFRGSTHTSGLFSGRGLSITLPSTIQPGDLLIAVAGTNGPSSSWTAPSGWTQGANSSTSDSQSITWWWKIADGSEAGTSIVLQSSNYADGGAVVNDYAGQNANPIAGVSQFTTTDNFGNGHVTSAAVSGVSLGNSANAVPLIFASWQPNATTVTWPNNFAFESAADDGYSFLGTGEAYESLTGTDFPGYTLSFSPGQAVVQTLQVLVNVE